MIKSLKEQINSLVIEKLISVQKHPTEELFIYNYSPRVQYEKLWNDITLQCRGLILDKNGNIVARPFKKFFNYEEHTPEEIPVCPFEVYDKLDGSLGILYWVGDNPFIATRGSFASEQAIEGTRILYEKYGHTFQSLNKEYTYLFEIIYPENRIVVNYKGRRDLILIAVIDTQTGKELPLLDCGFPIVTKFDGLDIEAIRKIQDIENEGFVLKYENGFRVKVKFEEYKRLHRILTGVSNIAIWEYLSQGKDMNELLDKVPDEFYQWVKDTKTSLEQKFTEIYLECKNVFKEFPTRKETALYFQTQKYPSVLFSMLDGKTPDRVIWRMIRPKFSKAFKKDD